MAFRLIDALLEPLSYPDRPQGIELRQTHISYLFFTPGYVYKIKKPVNFGFLDFTTLDKRLFYCNEEVRLNRRLAPSVYLGVVPVTRKKDRAFMEGEGEAVEYAVKMRRLPEEAMLDSALASSTATAEVIRRIARIIAAFHRSAETSPRIAGFGSIEAIRENTRENFAQTLPFVGKTVSRRLYDGLNEYTEAFLEANRALFERRVEGGFIRDCHGDIHSEHISIEDGVNIIDCIEFNERFRFSDVVADLAFLSMDMDFRNRADLSRALEGAYFLEAGDFEGGALMDFYKSYRAYVRGKVEGFKSAEKEFSSEERTASVLRAIYHFHLAGQYARGGLKPMLIAIAGFSGTGKSTLARMMSEVAGFKVISSDMVRKELAGIPWHEKRIEPYMQGIYSADFTEKTYSELIRKAAGYLKDGRSVILDATFFRARFLDMAEAAALEAGAALKVIKCASSDRAVKRNIMKREAEKSASDASWRIYLEQKKAFEELAIEHTAVDMERDKKENLPFIFGKIFG